MPHVSKKLLRKDLFLNINKELIKAINDLAKAGQVKIVFDGLFTKTEKLMLSKRFAIIAMLDRGESIYAIEQMLKVSPSTVARIAVNYEKGMYSKILGEIKKQNSFWTQLEKILPPRVGRNRFKNFLKF